MSPELFSVALWRTCELKTVDCTPRVDLRSTPTQAALENGFELFDINIPQSTLQSVAHFCRSPKLARVSKSAYTEVATGRRLTVRHPGCHLVHAFFGPLLVTLLEKHGICDLLARRSRRRLFPRLRGNTEKSAKPLKSAPNTFGDSDHAVKDEQRFDDKGPSVWFCLYCSCMFLLWRPWFRKCE